jgi:hypothetical protein
VPETGLASECVRRVGLQYRSNASQTGRQYCAVDSITTSSTSRSTSQSASARNWTGLVPTFSRSKWKSLRPRRQPPQRPTSSCARQSPRCGTALASPRESGERASSHQSGSRAIAGQNTATLNYSVNHARSGSNSCSASKAPWLIPTSPLPTPPFCRRFSCPFAGRQAHLQPGSKVVHCRLSSPFAGCRPRVTVAKIVQCGEPPPRSRGNPRRGQRLRVLGFSFGERPT